jgi:hypothetical protein
VKRRFWNESEIDYLQKNYRSSGASICASKLGRHKSTVYAKAQKLQLTEPIVFISDDTIVQAIKRRHPQGWVDSEIKKELEAKHNCGIDRHRIGKLRNQLGLPSNQHSLRQKKKISNTTRRQMKESGWESLSALRQSQWAAWKRSLGWPESLSVRAVQALEIFWNMQGVPISRVALCKLMGVSSKRKTAPISNKKGGRLYFQNAKSNAGPL